VLCDQCSLIAHSKCAHNAPPTCNLRAQLLLYARYAENGSSPLELLGPMTLSPSTDGVSMLRTSTDRVSTSGTSTDGVSTSGTSTDGVSTSRTSTDGISTSRTSTDEVSTPGTSFEFGQRQTPSPATPYPPRTFKVLSTFTQPQQSLSPEPAARMTPVYSIPTPLERRTSLLPSDSLKLKDKVVERSLSSNSSSPGPSSFRIHGQDNRNGTHRGASTRSESITSRGNDIGEAKLSGNTGYSVISVGSEHDEASPTDIPSGLPFSPTTSRRRNSKTGDSCLVQ